jgi:signal transduction histidine kinase/CheY-like chemotaxis protein
MSIIKYFNEAYNNLLSGVLVSTLLNVFIDRCMKFINNSKIKYYTLSHTPYINARQLVFNKKIVGYFLVNKTEEFNDEEEDNYNLFLNYLSLLLYNTQNLDITIIDNPMIDNPMIEILNTTNLNLIITDQEFNIFYYNDNFISFITSLNPFTQKFINTLKTKTLFDIFPQIMFMINTELMYKNKKININFIKNNKTITLELNINSIQYLDKCYNVITIDEKNNIKIIDNTSFLSHELRNPLQTIILASSIIKKNFGQDKYLDMIMKASDDMKKIINDILDLNKINNNELELTIEQVNIRYFMNDIIVELEANNYNNIKFDLSISLNVPSILFTDSTRLKQIIINLITNAIKYSKKNQHNLITINIYIDVEREKNRDNCEDTNNIIFEIQDQGIGIKKEDLNVLQEFNVTNLINSNNSNGLGLFICNKIIKLLGGTLNIKSEYDKGSTFIFTHPNKIGISRNLQDNIFFNDLNGLEKNILIVDDIEANIILLKMIIQNYNNQYSSKFNIDITLSGENCIELVKTKKYDIIFLDLTMELMDGYCTAQILRKNNFNGKIIVMTGNDKIKNSSYIELFDDILIKPFDSNSLLEIIKKLINN